MNHLCFNSSKPRYFLNTLSTDAVFDDDIPFPEAAVAVESTLDGVGDASDVDPADYGSDVALHLVESQAELEPAERDPSRCVAVDFRQSETPSDTRCI